MQMDSAFLFVSSSDRSKYIEVCQALSNLNSSNADPDIEDPVEIRTQKLKEVLVDEIALRPEVRGKALPDSRKAVSQAKSQSNRNQLKAKNRQPRNSQIQELVTKRSTTPRAADDQKKEKSMISDQTAVKLRKPLQISQARTLHMLNASRTRNKRPW